MLRLPASEIDRVLYFPTGGGFSGSTAITVAPAIAKSEPHAAAPMRAPSSTTINPSKGNVPVKGDFRSAVPSMVGSVIVRS